MKPSIALSFLGSLGLLASGQALAVGPSTTTQVRCFYKATATNTDPESKYEWALSSTGATYKISGNWWKTGVMNVKNVFLTTVTQATLASTCQSTLTKKKVTQPLLMVMASDNALTMNHTIWTKDSASQAAKINKVVVFGDSVSDNQNVYNVTRGEMPSPHSYVLGRFTNGKVWNEYLTDALKLPNLNWAVGGAAADDYYVIPGVVSQVDSFIDFMKADANYRAANSLFTVLVGANDMISYGRSVASILANEKSAIEKLIVAGARNILMLNVPDLSVSPKFSDEMGFKTQEERNLLKLHVGQLNDGLVALRSDLQTRYGSALHIQLFNTRQLVDDMLAHPANYGVTNTTQSCLDINDDSSANYAQTQGLRPGCTNADAYLFWDLLHPTTRSHQVIAGQVLPLVKASYPM